MKSRSRGRRNSVSVAVSLFLSLSLWQYVSRASIHPERQKQVAVTAPARERLLFFLHGIRVNNVDEEAVPDQSLIYYCKVLAYLLLQLPLLQEMASITKTRKPYLYKTDFS